MTAMPLNIYCIKRTVMKLIEDIERRQRKCFANSTQ
jgi:hypothetical protein